MPKGIAKDGINKGWFKKGNKTWNTGLTDCYSEETKKKMGEKNKGRLPWNTGIKRPEMSGDKNPNWKGGITSENHKFRDSLEMKLWRDAVFARDSYTCQKTGVRGGDLHCHHICNFADYPELRTSIENGIALSKKFHKAFHKKYGYKDNTKEQLEEFLDNN